MANNFIISYHSREGSSAIISALSNHSEIQVPIFEDLDWLHLMHHFNSISSEKLAAVLDVLYTYGKFSKDYFTKIPDNLGPEINEVVGMKWRLWNIDAVTIPILLKHNVHVFALERKDILANCVGYHLAEVIASQRDELTGPHIQFDMKNNPNKKEEIRRVFEEGVFNVNLKRILDLINLKMKQKVTTLQQLCALKASGVPVSNIYYEDFCLDESKFLKRMTEEIGIKPLNEIVSEFEKVSTIPYYERISNWNDIKADPLIGQFVDLWGSLMNAYEVKLG